MKFQALTPGRIVLNVNNFCKTFDKKTGAIKMETVFEAWMIISVCEVVARRHSKKTAPREGWNVVMMRFGEHTHKHMVYPNDQLIKTFLITPDRLRDWKLHF